MGCDIHSVIQGQYIKTEKPDSSCWHTVAEGFSERNYALFGYLAGVRDPGIIPLTEPRGWPDDFKHYDGIHPLPLNFQFRDTSIRPGNEMPWIMDMGEHSYTWYSKKEILNPGDDCPDTIRSEFYSIRVILIRLNIVYYKYTNWRVIIGFDS